MRFSNDLLDYIQRASIATGMNPNEISALIESESSGRPLGWHGTPNKSGYGYGGVTPGAAQQVGVTNFTDPYQNVLATAKYAKWLQTDQGINDPIARAIAYKAGPGAYRQNPNLASQTPYIQQGVNNFAKAMNMAVPTPAQESVRPAPPAPPAAPLQVADAALENEKQRGEMPVANEEWKKLIDDQGWMPEFAKRYTKLKGPSGSGASSVGGYSRAGLAGMENNAPMGFDARQDHGQQLMSLIGLLIGDRLGGARTRKRVQ